MKKILISARDLQIGGIEKSLINLINYLLEKQYKITLVLERKTGDLLKNIPKNVEILEYNPCENQFKTIRKTINLLKRMAFIIKYKNKFDTSISYATYLKSGSFVARISSKNSCLWCHADYLALFNEDKQKVEEFFEELKYEKFSKIIFVSKVGQENFLKVFPKIQNTYICNNLIDYNEIYKQTEEKIALKYDDSKFTFLNVGRHDEKQKRLSRIIEAAQKLKRENYNFRIIFVGEGKDTKIYKEKAKECNLEDIIIFMGKKNNPYPFFKIANAVVLSSDYEGYPVVFLESFILNKPIITTDVSDYKDVQNGRGIVVQKNANDLYKAMKKILDDGYTVLNKFDVINYNEEIKRKLDFLLQKY